MNTNDHIDSQEWTAQERAMRDARAGLPSTDPLAMRYRKVADALRAPVADQLPADFAASVARLAEANACAPEPALVQSARAGMLERTLLRATLAVLGLGSAVVVAMWGPTWIAPIASFLRLDSAGAVNWALALAACVGTTWLTDQLRRRKEQPARAA
ncbi:hypothetical protein LF41_1494 [Lysobacter dokdonensis DS-58]|uniref:Transmembrane protein n=1 Tax=Lysobacter dokdonensis DS-58 TaxID=1300345 RepID=A0A0A2WIR6_9GAMM|nr:hypothetical protein [Lysobacter dokdonensis]KGQ18140.1 hypothetical protein LF41_1494 [Lysobacter dokdonensis DS-58]